MTQQPIIPLTGLRTSSPLTGLRIENFRAFDAFEAGPFRRFNFIVGPTASGKTSVLHAIRLLEADAIGFPLLTGEMVADHRLPDAVFRNWDPAVPVRIAGDYHGGLCTELRIRSTGPSYSDVEFTWSGVRMSTMTRRLSLAPEPTRSRPRVVEIASAIAEDPGVVFSFLGLLAMTSPRDEDDTSEPWPAPVSEVPIIIVHDLDAAVNSFGPEAWPYIYRHALASNAQLFAAAALPEFLSSLDPAPPASETAIVTLG